MNLENTREVNTKIALGTVRDLIASHLYAISLVNDNEDIVNLEFGDKTSDYGLNKEAGELLPLKIKISSRREVKNIN